MFSTTEFFQPDFESSSYVVSHDKNSPFHALVICVKVYETEDGQLGRYTVRGDQLIRRVGLHKEVVKTFASERERINGLKKFCSVILDDTAIAHIRGTPAALNQD